MPLVVAAPLLVCQPGTSLRLLLAVAAPLLLPLLVCQPGTGLCVLLAVLQDCNANLLDIGLPLSVGSKTMSY